MSIPFDTDALIIGGGPAGAATGILLAKAGWRVVLVEQHEFPRQKVCGECISAGALSILDELGVGDEIRASAGPEIRQLGWMGSTRTITAPFPGCTVGTHAYGRAIGRDRLDSVLLAKARSLGVHVVQPARVRRVSGTPGHFLCEVEMRNRSIRRPSGPLIFKQVWTAQAVVDAHGSWELPLAVGEHEQKSGNARTAAQDRDLFAFKATFTRSTLPPGLLPVIAFPGGYGGIVVANDGRTTVACCIRRDALRACRASLPGQSAGSAVAEMLRHACVGIAEALLHAEKQAAWLSVGPIRPGIRVDDCKNIFRVGNAAGEVHPLIGEGINMALHSARLAATQLSELGRGATDAPRFQEANRTYATEWRAAFGSRMRYARLYAHIAMRPGIAEPLNRLLQASPSLMTRAARWAGKAHGAAPTPSKTP